MLLELKRLLARCEGLCAQRLALHDGGRLRRLSCVAQGSVASPKLAPVTLRFTPAQTTAMSQCTMCAARTDSPPCATQRHRGAPVAGHTHLRRLAGIPTFSRQLTCFAAGAVRRGDLCGGEKRRAGGGTRSVLRQHARRSCLSGGRTAHAASSAARPRPAHRSGVEAKRRPAQCEPLPGTASLDASAMPQRERAKP